LLQSDCTIRDKRIEVKVDKEPKDNDLKEIVKKGQEISIIHSEINLGDNQRLDLGIFKEKFASYLFDDGTKRWHSEDLDVAIEVKFIKNKSSFVDQLKKRFKHDIEKLMRCRNARKHLLIFSNKSIPDIQEWLDDFKEKKFEYIPACQNKNTKNKIGNLVRRVQ